MQLYVLLSASTLLGPIEMLSRVGSAVAAEELELTTKTAAKKIKIVANTIALFIMVPSIYN